ncbi:MAG: hypothetical protein ABF296_06110 [Oceanococcaceae bacterium]
MNDLSKIALTAAMVALFAGCEADGGAGGFGGGGAGVGTPVCSNCGDDGAPGGDAADAFNDDPAGDDAGNIGGLIVTDDGTDTGTDEELAYGDTGARFQCTVTGGDTSADASGGLVGTVVGGLLGGIGGAPVNALTGGVSEPLEAIDNDFSTFSTFTIAVSALPGGAVSSLTQEIGYVAPQSNFAVFAVSFPAGTLDLSLGLSVEINTFLDEDGVRSDEPTEPPVTVDASSLDLLGVGAVGNGPTFVGRKVSKPFNRASITLQASLLSANVGEAMYVHEICVGGNIVDAPEPTPEPTPEPAA